MTEIIGAVLTFLAIQLVLVTLIVMAKRLLLPSGEVIITVNEDKELSVKPGGKLLTSLAQEGIFTFLRLWRVVEVGGQCRCLVEEGGRGPFWPTDAGCQD